MNYLWELLKLFSPASASLFKKKGKYPIKASPDGVCVHEGPHLGDGAWLKWDFEPTQSAPMMDRHASGAAVESAHPTMYNNNNLLVVVMVFFCPEDRNFSLWVYNQQVQYVWCWESCQLVFSLGPIQHQGELLVLNDTVHHKFGRNFSCNLFLIFTAY